MPVELQAEFWWVVPLGTLIGVVILTVMGYRTGRAEQRQSAVVSGATTIDSRIGDAVVLALQDMAAQQKRTADAAEKALEQMSQTAADEATRALIDRELSERLAKMQMEHRKK